MNIVNVCSKYDVFLERNKINNDFIVSFVLKNDNVPLNHIADYSFFKILSDINDDVLEDVVVEIDSTDYNKSNMFFLFKPVAKEFGILSKCMSVNTIKEQKGNMITFESKNFDFMPDNMKMYEKITCKYSKLDIQIINDNLLHVKYTFNIDIHEELPVYMHNLIGMLMKKILLKSKVFIESI